MMASKLLTIIAGAALALSTSVAMAQRDGAPGGEKDRSGATTDSGYQSAIPQDEAERMDGTVGWGMSPDAREPNMRRDGARAMPQDLDESQTSADRIPERPPVR